MTQLQVGKYYEGKNGYKWRCIAVDGDVAWLTGAERNSAAYLFKTDGTNISQGGDEWSIKFEPVVEWHDTKASVSTSRDGKTTHHVFNIKFPTIDGKADFTQAKVEGA